MENHNIPPASATAPPPPPPIRQDPGYTPTQPQQTQPLMQEQVMVDMSTDKSPMHPTGSVAGFVQLPTKGIPYGDKLKGGAVKLSPMTAREEKLLSGARDMNEIVTRLLERCLIDCPVHPEDLTVSDRSYLLYMLRAASYGPEYEFETSCSKCQFQFNHLVVIPGPEVEIVEYEVGSEDDIEPFNFTLPVSKTELQFRSLRGKDERFLVKEVSEYKAKYGTREGDPTVIFAIARALVSLGGRNITPIDYKTHVIPFVEKLAPKDLHSLAKEMERHECGLKKDIEIVCPACGYTNKTVVPMGSDFFRPADIS